MGQNSQNNYAHPDTPPRSKIIIHFLTNTPPRRGEVNIIKVAERREKKKTQYANHKRQIQQHLDNILTRNSKT